MTGWRQSIREAMQRRVRDRQLAGALALVWHDGDIVLDESAGHRDIVRDLPMTRDTIFQIASMTKPIVSVAALQLVEEGKISLDDPIAKWLPEFDAMRVLDDPAGPLDRTHRAARAITVDDLLTHRAGFGYAFAETGPIAPALEIALGNVLHATLDPDRWLAALARLPLIYEPGSRFHYGHSTEVLGCLIARIDGGRLSDSLSRRVLGPLGMRDTAFFVPPVKRSRLAQTYRRRNGALEEATDAPNAPPLFEAGGGGLYSTPADYLQFARMMLGKGELDGRRVLRAETHELMTRNHLTPPQRALGGLGQPEFFAAMGFGYGVHVFMESAPPLLAGIGTMSWGGIFGTAWRADPVNRLISMFFAQDHADVSSGPERREVNDATPAGELVGEIDELVWRQYLAERGTEDGWVRLAPRRRAPSRPQVQRGK